MGKVFEEKGVISLEILFSIIIILSIIFFAVIVSVKINFESKIINHTGEASVIATSIIENMNSKTYSEFDEYINELSIVGMTKKIIENTQYITIIGDSATEKFFDTEIPRGYTVDVKLSTSNESFNILKEVEIEIKYVVSGKEENFKLSTVIEHDNLSECNLPVISEDYFNEIDISLEYYNIIPIKYSNENNSYIVTTLNDLQWYNYSAKQWAKVLVFLKDGDDLENQFIDENGIIKNNIIYNDSNVIIDNYIYVWIPNFTIKDEVSYFRYKNSKNIIKQDFFYADSKYLHLNRIGEEIADISKECSFDGVNGVWRKLGDEQDEYYKNFNLTKYAPIINY